MGSGHVHPAPLSESCLGRLDARAKILAFVPAVLFVNVLATGQWRGVVAVGVIFGVLFALCGRGAGSTLRRALFAAPFVLFVAVTLPFAVEGSEAFSLNFGFTRLVATQEGLRRAGSVVLRAGVSIMGILLLAGTTQAPDLFSGLRALGVPRAFVAIVSMIYRYLFEMGDELSRLKRSAAARGFEMRDVRAIRSMGTMAGALLIRSVVKSERVHHAMRARGFDGEVRTLTHTHFGAREALFMAVFYAATAALATAAIYA